MTRFVFETTESEKEALAAALQPVGKTFTDWFEEKLVDTITQNDVDVVSLCLPEACHTKDLEDEEAVAKDFLEADWSFTDADTGFLTHDVHPYPAKYIPHLPASIINRLSLPNEIVLDPFGGSGTTATEAVRLGRRVISVDANPLATLIGRVKTSGISKDEKTKIDRLHASLKVHSLNTDLKVSPEMLDKWLPEIPNTEKWFPENVADELVYIRMLIHELTDGRSRDIALLAMSRIIVRASNQDSETRYVSKDKNHPRGFVTRIYLDALCSICRRVEMFEELKSPGEAFFYTDDSRNVMNHEVKPDSVNLIVTSPPYPNATDYHLYHRFRIFWLGYDPKELGRVEIGSHLKHQRKKSGIEEYVQDMKAVMEHCYTVLSPGRYMVLIVGDAIFKGDLIDTALCLKEAATEIGFMHVTTAERPIHNTRRSFSAAARRARSEKILVLKKPDKKSTISLIPVSYKHWEYEKTLRELELKSIFNLDEVKGGDKSEWTKIDIGLSKCWGLNRLAFTSGFSSSGGAVENTWQKILENGDDNNVRKKESKYVTHGLHAYKGKFYPQLAKSLINISGAEPGDVILDPFCGSGTTLLEGQLNGYVAHGCDMNPLAVKVSKAKTEILTLPKNVVDQAIQAFAESLRSFNGVLSESVEQFDSFVIDEIYSWFPESVIYKLNWLISQIRLFGEPKLVNFLEVVLSDCIREVSHQDPKDLRIRRRATPLNDAPVIEIYLKKLISQHEKLKKFWQVSSRRPFDFYEASVVHGDCRKLNDFFASGLRESSVDSVVTSPPYATALPYIDTDRLSLMLLLGMPAGKRRAVEEDLTGSREIAKSKRDHFESIIFSDEARQLPDGLIEELKLIHSRNIADKAGFRRLNMPSLLYRYFADMDKNIQNVSKLLKEGGKAFYVVGDSKTKVGHEWFPIKTTDWLLEIARKNGLRTSKLLDISVTTENYKHMKNAITKNAILSFEKT